MPEYTAHAVPFRWMSRRELDTFVQPQLTEPLPPDTAPSVYTSDWVFLPEVQERILDGFFAPIAKGRSLAIFYTKSRQPIFDDVTRLIVGIGRVTDVAGTRYYDSADPSRREHPIWQREISHSLRPGGQGGFLIPYHEYLAPTGDPVLDAEHLRLAQELRITPEPGHVAEFSFRAEHVSDDATVSVLTQALRVVAKVREHGIAPGDWAATELWLNEQLAATWRLRGQYPGLGPVLQAAGLPMAASLVHLLDANDPDFARDPWRAVSRVLDERDPPPAPRFTRDIQAFTREWLTLENSPRKLAFAKALSRIGLTSEQAERWYDPRRRLDAIGQLLEESAIVENPYLISELDQGSFDAAPIGFPAIDRAVIGDTAGASAADVAVNDPHRVRGALVAVLRAAEAEGDTLLGIDAARDAVAELPVPVPVKIGLEWIGAHVGDLAGVLTVDEADGWVQLTKRSLTADRLRRTLAARANRVAPPVVETWRPLLEETVRARDPGFDPAGARSVAALDEQVKALETITSRKLTVLVGHAGTGKTTVLGALSRSNQLSGPILFLAPTGKARVRLAKGVTGNSAVQTVAQYLHSQGAYDGPRQEPKILGKNQGVYDGHRTVVVDEASMLTEDTLLAVLSTFSTNVDRLILVGDPAQLPPIGSGRPFADLVAHLSGEIIFEDDEDESSKVILRQGAYAKLSVEVRSAQGEDSDALRLAGLFSGGETRVDAEDIIGDLVTGRPLNNLDVRFWIDENDLHSVLTAVIEEKLELGAGDTEAFNASLGILPGERWPEVVDVDGAEAWQLLSPVRGNTWGVDDLNTWVQKTWRGHELRQARRRNNNWVDPFGPREIIRLDKVLLTSNLTDKHGWIATSNRGVQEYLANGEIGLCANDSRTERRVSRGDVMDIAFAGRTGTTYGFFRREFGRPETGRGVVDLAYALTIHKAQGSDFGTVIIVLPSNTRLASRELIYTALTRSRHDLVLLVQGDDLTPLLTLRSPDNSDTINRNTNLFRTSIRGQAGGRWARHLIHRTSDGTAVRSKSEWLIYETAQQADLGPSYERRLYASNGDGTWKEPDFTFVDAAGDPIIWEHLGMLDILAYAQGWAKKKQWYSDNGFTEGDNLFVTSEVGGFDAATIHAVIDQISNLV